MDNESLKRYQADQEKFFAELDTAGSPDAMMRKIVDMFLAEPLGMTLSAEQRAAAQNLTRNFLRLKGMKPAKAKEIADQVSKRVEFELWRRSRETKA